MKRVYNGYQQPENHGATDSAESVKGRHVRSPHELTLQDRTWSPTPPPSDTSFYYIFFDGA